VQTRPYAEKDGLKLWLNQAEQYDLLAATDDLEGRPRPERKLAMDGVPIAEQLVMSWGGWAQNANGRSTFREKYLGPVPDHVVADCLEAIPYETGPER